MKLNRNKIILVLVLMCISISILIYSFGYTTTNHYGDESSYLVVSEITFGLNDAVESISLNEQTPTIDKFGLLNESFNFSISNTSSNIREYAVRLVDKENISTIKNEEIRYQLTKNGVKGEVKTLSSSGIIDTGSSLKEEVIEYSIIVWLSHDAQTTGGVWDKVIRVEAGNVNIDTSGANEPMLLDNMIPVYYDESDEIWRKADRTNSDVNHKWYDYKDRMWANAVTVNSLNSRVYDLSGNENHGILRGNPQLTKNGVVFDGNSNVIATQNLIISNLAGYDFKNDITLAIKLRFNRLEGGYQGVFENVETGGCGIYLTEVNNEVMLSTEIYVNGGYKYARFSASNLNTTDVYSVVVTYDGSRIVMYVDGVQVAENTNATGNIKTVSTPFLIGAEPGTTGHGDHPSNITVYQAAILDRAVSAEEISTNYKSSLNIKNKDELLLHYDFSQVKDLSGNNNHGIVHGNPIINDDDSMTFDGVDDYIITSLEGHDFGNDITLAMRLKFNNLESLQEFVANTDNSGSDFYIASPDGIKSLVFAVHNGTYQMVAYPVSNLNTTDVYNIVGSYDGNSVNLYIDGVKVATNAASGNVTVNNNPFLIGADPNTYNSTGKVSNPANMKLYQAAIFDRALTEEEIAADYKNEINVTNNDELLVYYDFSKDYHLDSFEGADMPITDLSSFYTWIPRFKYDLFDSGSAKQINVTFEQGIRNTGTMKCSFDKGVQTCNGEEYSYTHPAFTFDGEELTGYWINKFELSPEISTSCYSNTNTTNCNKSDYNIVSLPNMKSLQNINISNLFNIARKMEVDGNIHGFKGGTSLNNDGTISGDINDYDIHLSRGLESSALSYLTYSQYGKYSNINYNNNERFVFSNNSNTKTGSSYINNNEYTYNTKQYGTGASTTGNIYGVYDLNGKVYEYVMSNKLDTNKSNIVASSGFSEMPLNKYYDVYSSNMDSLYGDTVNELNGFTDNSSDVLTTSKPFMVRKSVDSVSNANGQALENYGGRAVITVEQDIYITKW